MSEAAQAVATEVLHEVRKGRIPNKGKIIRKHGYSLSVSKAPTKVTKTKAYQSVVNPVAEQLLLERQRAIDELKGKISKAKYRDLVDAIDKLTKNHQLLTGGSTENSAQMILVKFVDVKSSKDH